MPKNLTRDNFVSRGSIDVGSKGQTRKTARPAVESLAGPGGFPEPQIDGGDRPNADGSRVCGAMSEQHGQDGRGNESVLQKFVHLVGCHDLNARTEQAVPRPVSRKR